MLAMSAATPAIAAGNDVSTPRQVAVWQKELGNHRVLLKVDKASPAVAAKMDWRRPGRLSEKNNLLVVHLDSGKTVDNRVIIKSDRESGEIIFDASAGPGLYAVYTHQPRNPAQVILEADPNALKKASKGKKNFDPSKMASSKPTGYKRADLNAEYPLVTYVTKKDTADAKWLKANNLNDSKAQAAQLDKLPQASVVAFEALKISGDPSTQSRNLFDNMETIATAKETADFLSKQNSANGFLVFPEPRENQIKMRRDMPQHWVQNGTSDKFTVKAQPGEYIPFQMGVYAMAELKNLKVNFSPISNGSEEISTDQMNCFQNGGNDWTGKPFEKSVEVGANRVQPMWCGIMLPKTASGNYNGKLTITADGFPTQEIDLTVAVSGAVLEDHGDSNPSKLTRLRWLDSTRGANDDDVVTPFTPLERKGNKISLLGREVELAENGLPKQLTSYIDMYSIQPNGQDLFAEAASLKLTGANGDIALKSEGIKYITEKVGAISFETVQTSDKIKLVGEGKLEADGYIRYRYTFTSDQAVKLDNVALTLPLQADTAKYVAGSLSNIAGLRPEKANIPIEGGIMYQAFWSGDYNVGVGCILKNHEDEWNAENKTKKSTPTSPTWENGGNGNYQISESNNTAVVSVNTGAITISPDEPLELNFSLLLTPFKPIRGDRWGFRINHRKPGMDPELPYAKKHGAKVVNLHHGATWNRHINYPFIDSQGLKAFVDEAAKLDISVKLYNTVRELSTRCEELWILRSLGDEILCDDVGFETLDPQPATAQIDRFTRTGGQWMSEHMRDNYRVRWHTNVHSLDEELETKVGRQHDGAFSVQGLSRWHNFYVEGLNWLRKNTGVRGVYLDGIGYDRGIIKRARKAMTIEGLPAPQIDFHGAVNYAWIQHAPYCDSMWYGEGAKYTADPAYWLVEVSGIPFGLTGEILSGSPTANQYRGMLYGMSRRLDWGGKEETAALWKLWDDFKIEDAEWIGYFSEKPLGKTNLDNVPMTIYKKDGESMLVIASWEKGDCEVTLDVDWKALGLDPAKVTLTAPAIDGMQDAGQFKANDKIKLEELGGKILIASEK